MTAGIETREIAVDGLGFRVLTAGAASADPVLCLHGFPHGAHSWRALLATLPAAGLRVIAPDQRGYSPGARPEGIDAYATARLVADALALADALDAPRFHLVGHDWGGALAWWIAARHPDRVASLSVLSRPHPAAFARAMTEDPAQKDRSAHHRSFLAPDSATHLLESGALRTALAAQGVPPADVAAYLDPLDSVAALDATLNWYRAAAAGPPALTGDMPAVDRPVLYLWGDEDANVGRLAAEGTADFVRGPYRFEELTGVGHFVMDQAGDTATRLITEHIGTHPM